VFAFIGFATVFIVSMNLLERVLGSQWQAFLTVAAVGFTAYRVLQLLFVRQRRELATGLPDPTARGARIAGAPRDRRLWH